jgi:hypothetical protein
MVVGPGGEETERLPSGAWGGRAGSRQGGGSRRRPLAPSRPLVSHPMLGP